MKKLSLVFFAAALLFAGAGNSMKLAAEDIPSTVREEVFPAGRYISGGVGKSERAAMEKVAGKYDLKLVFAKTNGNYISGVPFSILNSNGRSILDAVANGPWVFVDLTPGAYTVTASYKGVKKSREVQVEMGLKVYMFHWKS